MCIKQSIPIVPSMLSFDPALGRWVPCSIFIMLPQMRRARNMETAAGSRLYRCSVKTTISDEHIRIDVYQLFNCTFILSQ